MQINLTFESDFDNLYNSYASSTPERLALLDIEGISRPKLDVGNMSHAYFTENLSDISIDQNANANESIGPNNYSAEIIKGIMKLEGYYLLWRYANKRYGLRTANKLIRAILDGELYFHDPTGIQIPYCYAFSTTPLLTVGRNYGQLYSVPPKRADSFIAQVAELTLDLSQEFCGALAPSDVLVNYAWFAKREQKDDKAIVNDLQKIVHIYGNKFRVGGQSLRRNVPILINSEWVKIGDFVDSFINQPGETAVKIPEGHTILSFNTFTGETSFNKVYAVTRHIRKNPLMKVTLANGDNIEVTSDHSLFTLNENAELEECTPADMPENIIVPINFANDDNQVVDISKYKEVFKRTNGNAKLYDYITLDNKLMYLLGYFLGNGSVTSDRINLSVCNEFLENYFYENYKEFSPHVYKGTVDINCGKQFCAWVADTFGNNSHNKNIPISISLKSNSLYLIAGLIDSNGYLDREPGKYSYDVSSVSKRLIKSTQFTLQAHGILATYSEKHTNNNYIHMERTMHRLYISNDYAHMIPCVLKRTDYKGFNTTPLYDLTNIKLACRKVFRQSKYNWKANTVRYSVIDKLERDFTEILETPPTLDSIEEMKCAASLHGMPKVISKNAQANTIYNFAKGYNLNIKSGISSFKVNLLEQRKRIEDLLRKVKAMRYVIPIKVKSIEILEDNDEYVYDISVEKNENFVSANGIFAHNSPFTNVSLFDRANLSKVWGDYYYPDGSTVDIEYVIHIQKVFGEWFSKGDPVSGLPYRFPVVSANIYKDENNEPVDIDFLDWLSRVNIDKGCFNIYANEGTKIASCCRLTNNMERMRYRTDTLGGGVGLNIGSHRVVTINLPRIGIQADGDEDLFFRILDNRLEKAKKLLLIHREELLTRRIESQFLKFYNPLKWFSLDDMFSTVGIVGVYEANYFMGKDIRTEEGIRFTTKLLNHIENRLDQFSAENRHSFNCEEIPAESTAVSLATKDRILFGEAAQPFILYSNQYIPLIVDATMLERIKLSGKFMSLLSGGGILHLNIADKIHNAEQMKKLILVSIKNGVENFAVNYGFGECENGHVHIAGNNPKCPECGGKIVDYMTRVIGYFTKVSSWNPVRREYEFPLRKFMNINNSQERKTV